MDLNGKPGEYIWDEDEGQYVGRNTLSGNEDRRFVAQGDSSFMNGVVKVVPKWRPSSPKKLADELGPDGSNDYLLRGYGLILDLFTLKLDHWIVTACKILNTKTCGLIELITEISHFPEAEREAKLDSLRQLFDKEISRRDLRKYSYLTKQEERLRVERIKTATKRKLLKDFEKRLKDSRKRFDNAIKENENPIESIGSSLMGYSGTTCSLSKRDHFEALYSFRMPYGDGNVGYAALESEWVAYAGHHGIVSSPIPTILTLLGLEDCEPLLRITESIAADRTRQCSETEWDFERLEFERRCREMRNELMNRCPKQWRSDYLLLKEWSGRASDYTSEIDQLIQRYLCLTHHDGHVTIYPDKPLTFQEYVGSISDGESDAHTEEVRVMCLSIYRRLRELYESNDGSMRFDLPLQ